MNHAHVSDALYPYFVSSLPAEQAFPIVTLKYLISHYTRCNMRSSFFHLLPIVMGVLVTTAPSTVFACEGECIVGITNAFVTNYTAPIRKVLTDAVSPLLFRLYSQNDNRNLL